MSPLIFQRGRGARYISKPLSMHTCKWVGACVQVRDGLRVALYYARYGRFWLDVLAVIPFIYLVRVNSMQCLPHILGMRWAYVSVCECKPHVLLCVHVRV